MYIYIYKMGSSTRVCTCLLNRASTIFGLVLILAILLSAVLVLDLYFTIKVLGLDKYFPEFFYVFVKYLALSQELEKWLQ